jgi:hypothetical protein
LRRGFDGEQKSFVRSTQATDSCDFSVSTEAPQQRGRERERGGARGARPRSVVAADDED